MGTPSEHKAKAEHHEAFLATISDDFPDWLATVAFYAAVEYVEQLLSDRGHHSRDHADRKRALKQHFPNRQLNRAYNDLYNASLDARYLSLGQSPSAKDVRAILIEKRLRMVREYTQAHIKS